jgi:hypothetical protein
LQPHKAKRQMNAKVFKVFIIVVIW